MEPSRVAPQFLPHSLPSPADRLETDRWDVANLPDADLVDRIAGRDCEALAELYRRYTPSLLLSIRRFLPSPEDSEEVLQEVFLHVWKQAGRYDCRRAAVTTWLSLIARSRAIDRLRSQQKIDRTLARVTREKPTQQSGPEAMGTLLAEQRRRQLRRAMENLPTEQRRVLMMAFYEERTQSQIASAVDIPLGTVKTRTVLGMKKLRRALGSQGRQLL